MFIVPSVSVGPVRPNGKQSISVLDTETNTGKTLIADKSKVDEFMAKHKKSQQNCNKFWGSAIGVMLTAPFAAIGDLPKIARVGCGAAAALFAGLSILFGIKSHNAYKEKQAVLKDIENSQ